MSVIASVSGYRAIQHLDAPALGLVLEEHGKMPPASESRGIQEKQRRPVARARPHCGDQFLKSGTIFVLAGFNDVGELGDDRQLAFIGELDELAALGVD